MNTPATPTPNAGGHSAGATPERDQAQAAMWTTLAGTWKTNPQITLVYTTQAEFETAATAQAVKLLARQQADAPRPLLSNRLKAIRDLFAAAVPYIKGDLLKIFKKEGVEAAYPTFGLVQREDVWQFSTERLLAQNQYDQLVAALRAQGLTAGEYGADALEPLAKEFREKYTALVKLDQNTSDKVGAKNQGKPYLKKATKSLRRVLEGNYPDTYAQVARAWGIQKEKFGQG